MLIPRDRAAGHCREDDCPHNPEGATEMDARPNIVLVHAAQVTPTEAERREAG